MKKMKTKNNRGFAILFSVTLSAIILGIALGVTNIALKEIKFSTSAKSTNEAFFAADTAMECALINDKSTSDIFTVSGGAQITCNNTPITLDGSYPFWTFTMLGLGTTGDNCAKVSVFKDEPFPPADPPEPVITTIISKGYDKDDGSCNSSDPNLVEREIEITY